MKERVGKGVRRGQEAADGTGRERTNDTARTPTSNAPNPSATHASNQDTTHASSHILGHQGTRHRQASKARHPPRCNRNPHSTPTTEIKAPGQLHTVQQKEWKAIFKGPGAACGRCNRRWGQHDEHRPAPLCLSGHIRLLHRHVVKLSLIHI